MQQGGKGVVTVNRDFYCKEFMRNETTLGNSVSLSGTAEYQHNASDHQGHMAIGGMENTQSSLLPQMKCLCLCVGSGVLYVFEF